MEKVFFLLLLAWSRLKVTTIGGRGRRRKRRRRRRRRRGCDITGALISLPITFLRQPPPLLPCNILESEEEKFAKVPYVEKGRYIGTA